MRIAGYLFLVVFFICLHAVAMSDSADKITENPITYGFSPDQSRWKHYVDDADNTIYFYDTKSVMKQNNRVRVWIKFGEPMNDENSEHFYKEAAALKEIDCRAHIIRSVEWYYFSMRGDYKKYSSPTKWENIEPETAEDALLDEVCTQPGKGKEG